MLQCKTLRGISHFTTQYSHASLRFDAAEAARTSLGSATTGAPLGSCCTASW